jgi:outer membrane receptor protein involved in Fe transport
MKLFRYCNVSTCLAVIFCLTGTAAAVAETVLEEIIVTATKRGEVSVQDTVGAIRAVTGDFIEQNNLRTFEDIARLEPSLQFAKAAAGDLQPIIRGIQSPGAATVGVYFDEAVISGANFDDGGGRTPDVGAYDIERVEILKGPQGTLFGASSMSGTVRFISNKPDAGGFDSNFRIGGDTVADGDPGFAADGMINIPVSDAFAIRGVAWHESRGGFIDEYAGLNAVTFNENADEATKTGGRIMARFTPNENVTIDAFALTQETEVDGPVGFSPVLTGANTPTPIIAGPPFILGLTAPGLAGFAGERIITVPAHEENENEIRLLGLTMEADMDFGSLLLTVSDFDLDNFSMTDTTGIATNFGLLDIGAFFGGGQLVVPAPFSLAQNQDRQVTTAEIRFSSDLDGPFNFVTGVFYLQDDLATQTMVVLADPVTGIPLCTEHSECISDPTSAAFGHLDYELTDSLTLGAGIRYFDSDQTNTPVTLQAFQGSIPFTFPPAFGGPVQTVPIISPDASVSVSEVNWDASLGYRHDENHLYYFRAATGFRQGGVNDANLALQLGVIIPESYDPDTVTSLEVGAKTSLNDDRLFFNATYFKMFWDDIQVPGQDATGASNFINNAAKAEIDGVELELFARPTEQWLLTFGVTWLDAALTEDQALINPASFVGRTLPPLGLDGDKLPKAPEWAFSGSVEYAVPFPLMENVDMALRGNFSYTGKSDRFFNDSFDNNAELGDYFLLNLSADFRRNNWLFRIFANNVTDEAPTIDIFGNGADAQHLITAEPRSFGAQVQWRFK